MGPPVGASNESGMFEPGKSVRSDVAKTVVGNPSRTLSLHEWSTSHAHRHFGTKTRSVHMLRAPPRQEIRDCTGPSTQTAHILARSRRRHGQHDGTTTEDMIGHGVIVISRLGWDSCGCRIRRRLHCHASD